MSVSWVGMSFSARDSRTAPQASGTATARPTASDSSTVTASGRASGRTADAAAPPKPTPPRRAAIAGTENGPSASGWPNSPISPANSDRRRTTIPRAPTSRKTAATVLPSSTPSSPAACQLRHADGQGSPPTRTDDPPAAAIMQGEMGMRREASILHLDLDAFFAAVEQRDKPSLRGRPVVVGGVGGRGVVATASYEARAFGARSAMSTAEARRRCPAGTAFLGGRFAAYRATSDVVMGLLRELSPLVEPASLDEAYVDLAAGDGHDLSVEGVTAIGRGAEGADRRGHRRRDRVGGHRHRPR